MPRTRPFGLRSIAALISVAAISCSSPPTDVERTEAAQSAVSSRYSLFCRETMSCFEDGQPLSNAPPWMSVECFAQDGSGGTVRVTSTLFYVVGPDGARTDVGQHDSYGVRTNDYQGSLIACPCDPSLPVCSPSASTCQGYSTYSPPQEWCSGPGSSGGGGGGAGSRGKGSCTGTCQ